MNFYRLEGSKKKESDPTLVFINGLFADLSSYDLAIVNAKEHYQILRYDCRGQGQSPAPSGVYTLDLHVKDLFELVDSLKLDQLILIGLSNGGRIAMSFALAYPQRVKKVIAVSTYDVVTPMMKAKLSAWLLAYERGGGLHRFDVALPWIWGEEAFNEKFELINSYRERANALSSDAVFGLILGAMEGDIDVAQITCPLFFLVGNEDLLTPPFLQQKMHQRQPKSLLKIVSGGHALLIERPVLIDTEIIPWINL